VSGFWIDDVYDREMASNGRSRFEAYVRQHMQRFELVWWDDHPDKVRFAVGAWEVATPPVMAPGLVRRHPRVLSARVERSSWDGGLLGVVNVATGWPAGLADSAAWQGDVRWQVWPTRSDGQPVDPDERQVASDRFLLASVEAVFPLPSEGLPEPPPGPGGGVSAAARAAVEVLVAELNRVLDPVLAAVERP
jgi:hypothetical protein